ncbi:hypothetical protein PIB30_035694 [Stylosanthes scabra]|uniref:Uncharacterized protein n=1 Tax=Stylosanthes scabra TaxID=79078 RepID=A0ABU6VG30_9FABA|nr:hypothetical protein [Stylosanthes scabra]
MRFSAEAALSGFQQLAASFIATAVVSCSLAAYRSDLCVVLRRRRTAPPRFSSSPLTSISFLLPPSLPLPTTDVSDSRRMRLALDLVLKEDNDLSPIIEMNAT